MIQLQLDTKDDHLKPTENTYVEAKQYANNYLDNLRDAYQAYESWLHASTLAKNSQNYLDSLREDLDQLRTAHSVQKSEINETSQLLAANKEQQKLEKVEEIKQQLEETSQQKHALKRHEENLQDKKVKTAEERARTKISCASLTEQLDKVTAEESLWGRLFQKEANRFTIISTPLLEHAKKIARNVDVKRIKEYEENFSRVYNQAGDQLRNYNPQLQSESAVEVDDEERPFLGEFENYNNLKVPYFEADEHRQDIFELLDILDQQHAKLEMMLQQEDKELFEQIILDSVGKVLRGRIESALEWVSKMNELLKNQRNSSGLSLSIRWKELPGTTKEELGTKELIQLLRRDPVTLSDADIEAITRHFQSKVKLAQEQLETEEDEIGNLYQAIRKILDYRDWFEFELQFKRANQGYPWRPLTDNQFNIFSGGEKAIAMYLPLFAAVYSRYQDASESCPYIITLDEAFAGIDDMNISELFKACEELKFNYVMNSQAIYGEHGTISSLMTYELVRPLNSNFVTTIKYHWDGKTKKNLTKENRNER